MKVINFIKELRDSAERIQTIYTKGSCYRLCVILQTIFPEAIAYWSDVSNHAITEIEGRFYDIGGELNKDFVGDNGYYKIPSRLTDGYYLLKYSEGKDIKNSVVVEKYKK